MAACLAFMGALPGAARDLRAAEAAPAGASGRYHRLIVMAALLALTVADAGRYIRPDPARQRWRVGSGVLTLARPWSEAEMFGEGEGLELLGVFFTFILGLAIMVVLGKWWEA